MNIQKLLLGAICAIAVMVVSAAHASTIQWTLEGVTFNDSGTLSGTFATDSVTGNVLSWDLTSTAGSILGGLHYNGSDSYSYLFPPNAFGNYSFSLQYKSYNQPYINLSFKTALTSYGTDALVAGGFPANSTGSWECGGLFCGVYGTGGIRNVNAGYAISAVPEPQTYAMLLAGLGLIGFTTLRMKQNFAA